MTTIKNRKRKLKELLAIAEAVSFERNIFPNSGATLAAQVAVLSDISDTLKRIAAALERSEKTTTRKSSDVAGRARREGRRIGRGCTRRPLVRAA